MRILLVEPDYRKSKPDNKLTPGKRRSDDTLWYPPLGLMKLARFHKNRGDEVKFVSGCDKNILPRVNLFESQDIWDRVYITSLFTYNFKRVVETIEFYKEAVGGTISKIFVGGIMATLMTEDIYRATNVRPIPGILNSPKLIGLEGNENIDTLAPDYSILDPAIYAVNETLYAYTTRGCINKCGWCGVSKIEPKYQSYIDIKPAINQLRLQFGDMPLLKLMDNNVLASDQLERIVNDLVQLGYERERFTQTKPKRKRVIDFNQGIDASFVNEKSMKLISCLNIRPMRIAFDRVNEKNQYVRALEIAHKYGVPEFSNYMLYNFKDTPRDLYERLKINIKLNEKWAKGKSSGKIYSYPMRYAPINSINGNLQNMHRDAVSNVNIKTINWKINPVWTPRFMRNIEIIKGTTHGAIPPTPTLAWRVLGHKFDEYIANLYMPENLLRYRNKYEEKIYRNEPTRKPGNGLVELFREFIRKLLKKKGPDFYLFHNAVALNTRESIRKSISNAKNEEIIKWLKYYLKSEE
jgi:hypothetical protein